MINLEGIDDLEVIDFLKNNIKSIGILLLLAFILGFAISYLFFPVENVVSVEGITIDDGKTDNTLRVNPR